MENGGCNEGKIRSKSMDIQLHRSKRTKWLTQMETIEFQCEFEFQIKITAIQWYSMCSYFIGYEENRKNWHFSFIQPRGFTVIQRHTLFLLRVGEMRTFHEPRLIVPYREMRTTEIAYKTFAHEMAATLPFTLHSCNFADCIWINLLTNTNRRKPHIQSLPKTHKSTYANRQNDSRIIVLEYVSSNTHTHTHHKSIDCSKGNLFRNRLIHVGSGWVGLLERIKGIFYFSFTLKFETNKQNIQLNVWLRRSR